MKKNQDVTFTATCEGGTALVDLFVQDGSFKGASRDNIHNCDGWEDDAGVVYYNFEITCGARFFPFFSWLKALCFLVTGPLSSSLTVGVCDRH